MTDSEKNFVVRGGGVRLLRSLLLAALSVAVLLKTGSFAWFIISLLSAGMIWMSPIAARLEELDPEPLARIAQKEQSDN